MRIIICLNRHERIALEARCLIEDTISTEMTWTFIDRRDLCVCIDELRWKPFQLSVPNLMWEEIETEMEMDTEMQKGERKNEYKEPNSPIMESVWWEWRMRPTPASVPAVRAWAQAPALAIPMAGSQQPNGGCKIQKACGLSRRQRDTDNLKTSLRKITGMNIKKSHQASTF